MSKIFGIAGRKQSGKNTTANIIHGFVLMDKNMIMDFNIDQYGTLFIKTKNRFGDEGWGEFDINRKDKEFLDYAEYNLWPFVKLYSFADTLKWICIDLFNIPPECVYGTDEQKNTVIPHLLWENMPGVITPENAWKIFHTFNSWNYHNLTQEEIKILNEKIKTQFSPQDFNPYNPTWCVFPDKGIFVHKSGPMTAREFMQFFGSEIMRKMYSNIWIDNTIKRIKSEGSELAILCDVRFPNEINAIKENGGSVIKLTRAIHKDTHQSEVALDNFDKSHFAAIIDNQDNSYTIENLIQDVKSIYRSI